MGNLKGFIFDIYLAAFSNFREFGFSYHFFPFIEKNYLKLF